MAKRAGVPLVYVDPAYTSQQCSECGYIDRRNRQPGRSRRVKLAYGPSQVTTLPLSFVCGTLQEVTLVGS